MGDSEKHNVWLLTKCPSPRNSDMVELIWLYDEVDIFAAVEKGGQYSGLMIWIKYG